jgi:3-mercaptopyruvate sulfurtransferase SseA
MKIGSILILMIGLLLALPMTGCSPARSATIMEEETIPKFEREVAFPEVPRITAEELKQLMDKKGEYVIVDTRSSSGFNYGHIVGAINIYNDPQGDPFSREMMMRALPRNKLIILYCD